MQELPKPLQRAWAAGVFESRLGSLPKSQNTIRFDTNNRVMMERFKDVVGVGQVALHERNKGERRPFEIYIFRTTSMDDTRTLLKFVLPLLSPNKAAQASEMLARIERNPYWQKNQKAKDEEIITRNND